MDRCICHGKHLGSGVIHEANYLKPGEDQNPAQTLRVEHQQLPDTLFGVFPKSSLWRFMRPFTNNMGVRVINMAKFRSSALLDRGKPFRQSPRGVCLSARLRAELEALVRCRRTYSVSEFYPRCQRTRCIPRAAYHGPACRISSISGRVQAPSPRSFPDDPCG